MVFIDEWIVLITASMIKLIVGFVFTGIAWLDMAEVKNQTVSWLRNFQYLGKS